MSTGRNFFINLGGNVLGLALFAALTPMYFQTIGAERYGVVTVVLSLSMYVSTFNFGMGPALTYHIAGDLRGDIPGQSEAFWSAMALSTPIGLVASLLLFGFLPLGLADLMHLTPAVRGELRGAFIPLVGIGICTILASNPRGALGGRQAFLTLAAYSSAETTLAILFPVLTALFFSSSVSALLYATFAARVVLLVGGIAICWLGIFARNRPRASVPRIRQMLGYGGWITLSTLVETVLSSADRLMLGSVGSASQVPLYSIPLSVTSRSTTLPLSLLASVFPKYLGAEPADRPVLMSKTVRFLLLLTPGYAFVVAVAAPFLRYWISIDFAAQAALPLQILAIATWIDALSSTYYYQLNADGNVRANFVVVLGIVGPYIVMLAIGAWLLGATGIAIAYLARNCLMLAARAILARVPAGDVRAITINAVPLALTLLLAAHRWPTLTWVEIAWSGFAVLLSCTACLWTRPHNLQAIFLGLLPTRLLKSGVAV